MLAFSSSPRLVDHDTGPHHPERPDRLRAIHRAVREAGLIDSPDPFPEFTIDLGIDRLATITDADAGKGRSALLELIPTPADERWLHTVHTPRHIDLVKKVCQAGGGMLDQGDTPVGKTSHELALLSLGSLLRCCDAVIDGRARRAFSAARPPGHHAEPDRPMGFCLYSNVAIAARYLQQHHGLSRIAIVDFDVHHGNGTQAVFEADPSVLFISVHQSPETCYPGSGHAWEIGVGPGRGFTLNLPLPPGSDDSDYLHLFDKRIIPRLDEFHPELILVSAGFDAHKGDPLAEMAVSEDGFEQMTRALVGAAERNCSGRLVSALEGGYDLRSLGRSVVRHLSAMR